MIGTILFLAALAISLVLGVLPAPQAGLPTAAEPDEHDPYYPYLED